MGTNISTSASMPLTAKQMAARYQASMDNIQPTSAQYDSPGYQMLSDGDYNALQNSIYKGQTAGLDEAWSKRKGDINQEMSDRGIWASGAPIKVQNETYGQEFLPAYERAAANAVAQRYGMQAQDLQSQNAFNLENANREYEAQWRPADYKLGAWNGSGGVMSSGASGGWSI